MSLGDDTDAMYLRTLAKLYEDLEIQAHEHQLSPREWTLYVWTEFADDGLSFKMCGKFVRRASITGPVKGG